MPSPTFSLVARIGHPSFPDPPWHLPLARCFRARRRARAGGRLHPGRLRGKRAAAAVFHELLEHRSELAKNGDVDLAAAISSCGENVLGAAPDERAAIVRGDA